MMLEESQVLEYKRELPSENKKWLKTIISFSNTSGGRLIVGVEDKTKHIVGIKASRSDMEQRISESIYSMIEPKPSYTIDYINIAEKEVLILEVFRGNNPPYHFKGQSEASSTYVRYGSLDQLATENKILELKMDQRNERYTERVFKVNLLDKRIDSEDVDKFLEVLNEGRKHKARININKLVEWNILKENNGYLFETIGYNLLNKNINNYYSSAIRVGVFETEDKSIIIKDKFFRGSILDQYIESVDYILESLMSRYEIRRVREPIYRVPETVVRELLANALIHRSYLEDEIIKVELYSDRMEVESPGSLYQGLLKEEIESGKSRLRNKNISEIFYQMGYTENWGSGIMRSNQILRDSGRKEIDINTHSQLFVTAKVYYDKVNSPKYIVSEEQDYLENASVFTVEDIKSSFNISQREALRTISEWEKDLRIKRIEDSSSIYYKSLGKKKDSLTK